MLERLAMGCAIALSAIAGATSARADGSLPLTDAGGQRGDAAIHGDLYLRRPSAMQLGLPDPVVAELRAAMLSVELVTDRRPVRLDTVEPGAIFLDAKIHFVPIHLYPVRRGLHDTFAVVIDTQSGLKPIRLEVAGTGVEGGAEGEVRAGKRNLLHGMLLNTPVLLYVEADDTIELWKHTLTGSRVLATTLRAGATVWNVPQLSFGQLFLQAGARLDTMLDGASRVHFEALAGPSAIARARPWLGVDRLLAPGVELLGQITVEK